MAKRDFYEILGVGRGASADEIKKSYRKIALAVSPGSQSRAIKQSEERFKEAAEAYDALKQS